MPLLSVLLVLIVIGVVLWLVNTYIPMAPPIKTVINVLVVLVLCLWLLSLFGIGDVYVGHRVR
jgi:type IV secretory pathway TrbD component